MLEHPDSFCIAVRVLVPSIAVSSLKTMLKKYWKPWTIKDLIKTSVSCIFKLTMLHAQEKKKILQFKTWRIYCYNVLVEDWIYYQAQPQNCFSMATFFMQIHSLPADDRTEQKIRELLRHVGAVLSVDVTLPNPRVEILMNLLTPFWPGHVFYRDEVPSWAAYRYENLHTVCKNCGMITHQTVDCVITPKPALYKFLMTNRDYPLAMVGSKMKLTHPFGNRRLSDHQRGESSTDPICVDESSSPSSSVKATADSKTSGADSSEYRSSGFIPLQKNQLPTHGCYESTRRCNPLKPSVWLPVTRQMSDRESTLAGQSANLSGMSENSGVRVNKPSLFCPQTTPAGSSSILGPRPVSCSGTASSEPVQQISNPMGHSPSPSPTSKWDKLVLGFPSSDKGKRPLDQQESISELTGRDSIPMSNIFKPEYEHLVAEYLQLIDAHVNITISMIQGRPLVNISHRHSEKPIQTFTRRFNQDSRDQLPPLDFAAAPSSSKTRRIRNINELLDVRSPSPCMSPAEVPIIRRSKGDDASTYEQHYISLNETLYNHTYPLHIYSLSLRILRRNSEKQYQLLHKG